MVKFAGLWERFRVTVGIATIIAETHVVIICSSHCPKLILTHVILTAAL